MLLRSLIIILLILNGLAWALNAGYLKDYIVLPDYQDSIQPYRLLDQYEPERIIFVPKVASSP
jgi:hypothetical protein